MTFLQALVYFLREATTSALRSWRATSLAVVTISMSLLIGSFFLLTTGNLASEIERWGRSLKVIVYLSGEVTDEEVDALAGKLKEPSWIVEVEHVTSEQAEARFKQNFPSLGAILTDWETAPLPPALEAYLAPEGVDPLALELWVTRLRGEPGVSFVDDDREWLVRLSRLLSWSRVAGLGVAVGMLFAASFTIASVVRLTAYLYQDEIDIMRLVGSTEFFIRGPFYIGGFLQGLVGGLIALLGLYGVARLALGQTQEMVWIPLLFSPFLPWSMALGVVAVGGAAGLAGAVLSLRRESLRVAEE